VTDGHAAVVAVWLSISGDGIHADLNVAVSNPDIKSGSVEELAILRAARKVIVEVIRTIEAQRGALDS
jgi:hypothetical protein